jgi:hypothetical protein
MVPSPKVKTSAQFIADALKKPIPAEKLTEALEKIRKGATSSLSLSKVLGVLNALGWKIQPTAGWIPWHFRAVNDGNRWVLQSVSVDKPEELSKLQEAREKILREAVNYLPDRVTVGKKVVMEVSSIKEGGYGNSYFQFKEWTGGDGIKLTTPRGKVIDILPGRGSVGKPLERALDYERELTAGGWKLDASAALGKQEHVPAEARTRENTGTCPVCWGNYKLSSGHLVLHGYQRPGWGHVNGSCDGTNYEPLETSATGAKMWLEKLEDVLKKQKANKDKIDSNQVSELLAGDGNKGRWIKAGEPGFRSLYERFVRDTESNIKLYERDIELYKKVIAAWKVRPLPQQGEVQRDMRFFTK